ncbi:hypothetical protein K1X09_06570 [Paenibacillus lautus]|nr:hypothetical protein [Paenibacillus lautus]
MRRYPLDFDGKTVKGFPEDLIITTHVRRLQLSFDMGIIRRMRTVWNS